MKTTQVIGLSLTQTNIKFVDAPIFLDFETAQLSLTEPYDVAFVVTSLNDVEKVINTDQVLIGNDEEGMIWLGYGVELVSPKFAPEPDWFEAVFNPEVCPIDDLPF